MLNETLLAALSHAASLPPGIARAYSALSRAVRPTLHGLRCSCWICTTDHDLEQYRAELMRADSEEEGESDRDIDFVRAMGGAA